MRNWLKNLRDKKGMLQTDVAKKIGISHNYYCMIENGERQKKLSIEMAQKLADVFGVTFEYICDQENRR